MKVREEHKEENKEVVREIHRIKGHRDKEIFVCSGKDKINR